jgi:2-polyprenyl-3-methyl-5-hydroxy-6-metoxy-1,4-benzoquinol methylase
VDVITILGVLEHFDDLRNIKMFADHLYPKGILYIEVPNCLAYSNSKDEGWRKTTGGTGQTEWHLTRNSWERNLYRNGLIIEKALTGKSPYWEFVWICQFV